MMDVHQPMDEQRLNADLDAYIALEAGGPCDVDGELLQASEEHLLEQICGESASPESPPVQS